MLKQIIIILLFIIPAIGYSQFPGAPTIPNKKISHNVKLQNVEGSSIQMSIPFSDYIKDSSGVYSYRHVPFDSLIKYKGGNFTYLISNLSDTLLMKPVCGDIAIKTIDSCAKDVYIYRCTPNSYSSNRIGWYNSGSVIKRSCLSQGGGGGSTSDVRWGGFTISGDSVRLDSVSSSGIVLGSKWIANVVNKTELDIYKTVTRYLSSDSLIIQTYSWSDALQQYISSSANTVYVDNCINKKVKYEKINDTTLVYYQPDFGNDTIIISPNFTMYAKNGLHVIGDTSYLGGTLTQNTRVSGGNNTYSMVFDSLTGFRATSSIFGNIRFDFRTSNSNLLNYWTLTDSTNNVQVFLKMNSSLPSYGFMDLSTNKSAYIRPYNNGSSNVIEVVNDGYGANIISSSGNEQLSFTNGVDAAPKLFFYNIQNDSLNLGSKFGTVLPLPTKPIKVGYVPKLININTAEWTWGPDSIGSRNWYNTDDTLTTDRIAEGNFHNARWTNMTMIEFDSIGSFWIRAKANGGAGDAIGQLLVTAGTSQLLCNNPNGFSSTLGGRQNMALITANNAELRSQPYGSSGTAYTINSIRTNDISAAIEMPRIEYDGTYSYARATYLGLKIREGTIPIAYRHGGGTRDNTGGRLIYSPYRFPLYAAPDSNYVLTSRGDSLTWKLMSSGGGGGSGSGDSTWYKSDGTLISNRIAYGGGFSAKWTGNSSYTVDEVTGSITMKNAFSNNTQSLFNMNFGASQLNHVNSLTGVTYGYNSFSINGGGATMRATRTSKPRAVNVDTNSVYLSIPILNSDGITFREDLGGVSGIPARRILQTAILNKPGSSFSNTTGTAAWSSYGLPAAVAPDSNYIMVSKNDTMVWKPLASIENKRSITINAVGFSEGLPVAPGINFETFFLVPADMDGWNITNWELSLGQQGAASGTMTFGLMRCLNGVNPALPVDINKDITIPANSRYLEYGSSFSQVVNKGDLILIRYKSNSGITGTPKGCAAKLTFNK